MTSWISIPCRHALATVPLDVACGCVVARGPYAPTPCHNFSVGLVCAAAPSRHSCVLGPSLLSPSQSLGTLNPQEEGARVLSNPFRGPNILCAPGRHPGAHTVRRMSPYSVWVPCRHRLILGPRKSQLHSAAGEENEEGRRLVQNGNDLQEAEDVRKPGSLADSGLGENQASEADS